IDRFGSGMGAENDRALAQAREVIAEGMEEYWDWMRRRQEAAHAKPPTAAFFPIYVDLSNHHVVFVGGGTIAMRRIRTLLPFVDDIVVYAPDFSPELERFAVDGAIRLVRKEYDPSVLDGADIVMVCTNKPDLNDEVYEECKRRDILVNVCSDRFKCDFHFPGVAARDNIVVGVSAAGKDHRRVKQVRARIQALLDEEDL
ncbi:MAG: bifunctional precorrin-2 dehydrogenase/sirohydrochlorin ferrochelatase, partial [Eggerthellaceae bacterium]|nr:bifunctional precorrin-2 dehydrogenase/sirohydrochlorin ferrochelatase [Eggerthellaceae bacterium]